MRALLEFSRREDFSSFLAETMENPAVQGVTVDVDRTWLRLARARQILPPAEFSFWERDFLRYLDYGPDFGAISGLAGEFARAERGLPNRPIDWGWQPNWWDHYCSRMNRPNHAGPFVVRVCMLPRSTEEQPLHTEGFNFPVLIERRPQARLCSTKTQTTPLVGGLSIGVGPLISGTLGGIVRDTKLTCYGVTCAHVAPAGSVIDQPAHSDFPSASYIGNVVADSGLKPASVHTPCHPANPRSILNQIDAALIELSQNADLKIMTLGALTRVFPEIDLNPGDSISFVGKESGPQERILAVGGLTVVFRFTDDGVTFYQFENTFEVEWPNAAQNSGGPPIQAGDSGAWLCVPDAHGYAWAGVALGYHRNLGYAIPAQRTEAWINNQVSHGPVTLT